MVYFPNVRQRNKGKEKRVNVKFLYFFFPSKCCEMLNVRIYSYVIPYNITKSVRKTD